MNATSAGSPSATATVPDHLRGFCVWHQAPAPDSAGDQPGCFMNPPRCVGRFDTFEEARRAMLRATEAGEYKVIAGTRYDADQANVLARRTRM